MSIDVRLDTWILNCLCATGADGGMGRLSRVRRIVQTTLPPSLTWHMAGTCNYRADLYFDGSHGSLATHKKLIELIEKWGRKATPELKEYNMAVALSLSFRGSVFTLGVEGAKGRGDGLFYSRP